MTTESHDLLFEHIIADTFTTVTLRKRLALVREYFEKTLFGGNFVVPSDIEPRNHTWLLAFIEEYEKKSDSVWRTITKTNISSILTGLEEKATHVTPITIFLPILLPPNEVDNLGRGLRQVYGKGVFMELRLDPLLIAGAALAWKGVYKDYSLKQKIRDNQDQILKSFAKYTQK